MVWGADGARAAVSAVRADAAAAGDGDDGAPSLVVDVDGAELRAVLERDVRHALRLRGTLRVDGGGAPRPVLARAVD